MKKASIFLLFILILQAALLCASEVLLGDNNEDGKPDEWLTKDDDVLQEYKADRNFDGLVDQKTAFDEAGNIKYEEFDYNWDGRMDDFYFFEKSRLVRQEIDSNFDDRIDIWIYLKDGVYIEKIARDMDFDGEIDRIYEYDLK